MPNPMYATVDQLVTAFKALSAAEYERLQHFARIAMHGAPFASPSELITDAVTTAFFAASQKGGRRWRADVPFMSYLTMTIRGLASDARRALRRRGFRASLGSGEEPDEGLGEIPQLIVPSLEQQCADDEEKRGYLDLLERLREHFKADPQILAIINGLARDMTIPEIRREAGMSETAYESARRRLRRATEGLRQAMAAHKRSG